MAVAPLVSPDALSPPPQREERPLSSPPLSLSLSLPSPSLFLLLALLRLWLPLPSLLLLPPPLWLLPLGSLPLL